jgi:hypothetical protein
MLAALASQVRGCSDGASRCPGSRVAGASEGPGLACLLAELPRFGTRCVCPALKGARRAGLAEAGRLASGARHELSRLRCQCRNNRASEAHDISSGLEMRRIRCLTFGHCCWTIAATRTAATSLYLGQGETFSTAGRAPFDQALPARITAYPIAQPAAARNVTGVARVGFVCGVVECCLKWESYRLSPPSRVQCGLSQHPPRMLSLPTPKSRASASGLTVSTKTETIGKVTIGATIEAGPVVK